LKIAALVLVLLAISCVPCLADDDGGDGVKVDVAVTEFEPGEEPPSEELPKVGLAPEGAPWRWLPKGPFDWISQHPLALTVLQMPAESAYTLPEGRALLAYRLDIANNFVKYQEGDALFDIDLESYRQTISYRRGMSERVELGVFVPVHFSSRGIFDGWIESWHGFFGLPTGDRPLYNENEYTFVVANGNEFRVLGESDSFGFGDVSFSGKYFIRPEGGGWPAISARAAIKIPTGEPGDILGSGGFDAGFDLLAQKTFGRMILYGQTGYVFTGGNDLDLEGNDIWKWSLAGEYQANRKHSWLIQFHHQTNPYKYGINDVDQDTLEMALGFKRYLWRNVIWEGGFSEDIAVDTAPDFAIFSQFTYHF
jgi:hypothetical protein